MKGTVQKKSFEVKMGVRHKDHSSGQWEIRTVRVEAKLDDLAVFAASLHLKKDYPGEEGWEIDLASAEVIAV